MNSESSAYRPPVLETFFVAGSPNASWMKRDVTAVLRRLPSDPVMNRSLPAFASWPASRFRVLRPYVIA